MVAHCEGRRSLEARQGAVARAPIADAPDWLAPADSLLALRHQKAWRTPNSVPVDEPLGEVMAPVSAWAAPLLLEMRANVA